MPAERCVPEAQALAATLARGPRSVGLIKRELLRNGLGDVHAALAYEVSCRASPGRPAISPRASPRSRQARAELPRRVSVALRRATPDDGPLLAEHRACVWYEYGDFDEDAAAAQSPVWAAWMTEAVRRGTYAGFIAEESGAVVGSAAVVLHDAIPRPGYAGDRDGRVHSVVRHAGGTKARHRAGSDGRAASPSARDAQIMRLTLHPTDASRALYAALGFEPLDEMGLYFGP